MEYRLDDHALDQMKARRISERQLDEVLNNPGQVVQGNRGRNVYQSRILLRGKTFVLRAFVETRTQPALVVSVYLTDKVRKYWQSDEP